MRKLIEVPGAGYQKNYIDPETIVRIIGAGYSTCEIYFQDGTKLIVAEDSDKLFDRIQVKPNPKVEPVSAVESFVQNISPSTLSKSIDDDIPF